MLMTRSVWASALRSAVMPAVPAPMMATSVCRVFILGSWWCTPRLVGGARVFFQGTPRAAHNRRRGAWGHRPEERKRMHMRGSWRSRAAVVLAVVLGAVLGATAPAARAAEPFGTGFRAF